MHLSDIKGLDVAAMAMDLARKFGAEAAEGYVSQTEELNIEVRDSQMENLKLAREQGLGIRALVRGRMGYAFTSDLDPGAIERTAALAVEMAGQASSDAFNAFPRPWAGYPQLDLYDPAIGEAPLESKIELARQIEAAGRACDPRVKVTESCAYHQSLARIAIVNSMGLAAEFTASVCGGHAVLVAAEDGDYQTGFSLRYGWHLPEIDPEKIGWEAAQRAVRMLGARNVRAQEVPVVFDPYVMASFLGILAPALTGQAVQKGKSVFAGKLGQQVGSAHVTIIDNGLNTAGIGASPFDGEGVPSRETVLIKEGQLVAFLHNTYTAAKEGATSTGNGNRGSFRSTPEVGPTNFYLAGGDVTPDRLVAGLQQGFYVTQVMGMHTANPVSGDFSVGAAGLWIEDGELAYPVRGAAIAGNLVSLLQDIEGVGDDLTFLGSVGAPTVCIGRMCVSG